MGYCMQQTNGRIKISAEKQPDVFNAIRALMERASSQRSGHFPWVRTEEVLRATSLFAQLTEWRWIPNFDAGGNIVDLDFVGEKLGDDLTLFQAIAPWVDRGSYLDMLGEDGEHWRWYFDGMTCQELNATVQFATPADGDILEGSAREVPEPKSLPGATKRLS